MNTVVFSRNMQEALASTLAGAQKLAMILADALSETAAEQLAAALEDGGTIRVTVELPIARLVVTAERAGDVRSLFDVTLDHRSVEALHAATH